MHTEYEEPRGHDPRAFLTRSNVLFDRLEHLELDLQIVAIWGTFRRGYFKTGQLVVVAGAISITRRRLLSKNSGDAGKPLVLGLLAQTCWTYSSTE